jgi:hypothetical protein
MLILPLAAILVGCEPSTPSTPAEKNKTAQDILDNRIRFVKIDNCEYIVTGFNPFTIIHKGNCTNHK